MAGTRTTPRQSARSSPRSTRSTPAAKPSTPLKQSTTSRSRKSNARSPSKTSPYFPKTKSGRSAKTQKTVKREDPDDEAISHTGMTESSSSSSDAETEDAFDPSLGEEEEEVVEDDDEESELDSDFLDGEDDDFDGKKGTKRKSVGGGGSASKKVKTTASGNGRGKTRVEGYKDEEDGEEIELEEGQEIAGRIYPAPKTGQVPPGQISRNTMNFLKNLQIPERNDRDWFRSHEPAFRQAETEWKAFVGMVQLKFHEVDEEVPILPPKDVIHRIYRDVRFSSDKTPYKRSFSLSTSRGGRKGVWACYHLSISPNNHSILAAGIWQPGKNELQTIRHHLLTDPTRFRQAIAQPKFVELFGPSKPHPKGKRQNVFGHDDALKVAPKGYGKDHKEIDILKLRTVAVVHHFDDEEVVADDFPDKVAEVVTVMAPFVHMLNDFVSIPPDQTDGGPDDGENGDDADVPDEETDA